jgi:hypothetical protein
MEEDKHPLIPLPYINEVMQIAIVRSVRPRRAPALTCCPPHRTLRVSPRPPQEHEEATQAESLTDGASTHGLVASSRGHAMRTMLRAKLAIGAFPLLYQRWGQEARLRRLAAMGTAPGT